MAFAIHSEYLPLKVPMDSPKAILERNRLRKTNCRTQVLQIFLDHPQLGLSENFVEAEIEGEFDRATIYRTLNTFLSKGVLHTIYDEKNAVKYALCSDHCSDGDHNHDHLHFKCVNCGQTSCMDNMPITPQKLPKGYKKIEANYLIIGVCGNCNAA